MSIKDLIHDRKWPTSNRKYVGIEIEFLIPKVQESKLEDLLIEKNLQWNVHLGGDGSVQDVDFIPIYNMVTYSWSNIPQQIVTNENYRKRGYEIRILAEEKEAPSIVNKCCEVIKQCNGVINHTCGLHVHIDMRNRDYNKVYNNLFHIQSLMFATQPKSRHKNKYCRKLPRLFKGNAGRYYSINKMSYEKHRTIEVRLHEGTLSAKDILMWTGFLIKIANIDTMLDKKIKLVEELDWLPESLKVHLNERIKKYS